MSVKNDIFKALVVQLETIRTTNGYSTNVADKGVTRYLQTTDMGFEFTPSIAILETGENILVEDDTNIRFSLVLSLIAYLKAAEDCEGAITKFADDIKKLIYSPVSLGSYVLWTRITAEESIQISSMNEAVVHIGLEIIYYASKAGF